MLGRVRRAPRARRACSRRRCSPTSGRRRGEPATRRSPTCASVDGWVYSSLPLEVARRRRRRSRSGGCASSSRPAGELDRGARRDPPRRARPPSGSRPRRARPGCGRASGSRSPPTDDHVGSIVVRAGGRLMELRLLALYPEQMNIYADRGNILFLQRRCEWRGIGFELRARRARRGLRPRRPRPDLHRRRPGPRPAAGRRRHGARPSARRSPPRSTTAPSCSPSAAATSCSATATSSATSGSPGLGLADLETVREPGPRLIGNVAIEVDLGDGPRVDRRLREPRRPHLPRRRRRAARPGARGPRQQRRATASRASAARNLIGTYLHGPLLPKNAWLADRLIALALARRDGRASPSSSRSTTRFERRRPRVRERRGASRAAEPSWT